MKEISMSEYDPQKKYPEDTVFVLDDTPLEIPIPEFLKKKSDKKEKIDTTDQQ